MSQDFMNTVPLIDFHGNNGNISGASAAATRYTECRLSKFAETNIENIDCNAVDMVLNYDNTQYLPVTLPVKLPLLLLNGSYGIAAGGYSQSIPTHNLEEVCKLVIELLDNPNLTLNYIAKKLVPDFPTGGILCSKEAIEKAYKTGRGSVALRGRVKINGNKINIVEIPYMTTLGPRNTGGSESVGVLNSIVNKVKDGTIEGIRDIKDLSNKNGINIEIILKKDYDANIVVNQLYKFTQLEKVIPIILIAKKGNTFKEYNIKECFTNFIEYRTDCIRREIIFKLNKFKNELHINEGLLIALDHIDRIVEIIKSSESRETALETISTEFTNLTRLQINAILDMRLVALTNLEKSKIEDKIKELNKIIKELKDNLKEENIKNRIRDEQLELISKYKSPRKTTVEEIESNGSLEEIIPDEKTLVILSTDGYIKRVADNIPLQNKNTKGSSIGSQTISDIYTTTTKSRLLCFSNLGRVFDKKVYEIDETSNIKNKGRKVESYFKLQSNEYIIGILCLNEMQFNDSESFLLFTTKNSYLKKTKLSEFSNIFSTGIIAINLKNNDSLIAVNYVDSNNELQDVLLSSKNGLVVRYDTNEISPSSRNSIGVIGMNLDEGDYLVSAKIISDEKNDLVCFVTKNGYGKTVAVTDNTKTEDGKVLNKSFPRQIRSSNAKGRIGIKLKEDDELVSMLILYTSKDQIIISTNQKILGIKSSAFTKSFTRSATGSKLIDLNENEYVIQLSRKNILS